MCKILLLSIIPILLFASYNPFFNNNQTITINKQQSIAKKVIYKKVTPARKNIKIIYFGFIHSEKGKFALIHFENKNIVVYKNDSLYVNEQIFKIKQITSNHLLLKDKYNRSQIVYFSSLDKKGSQKL